MRAETLSRYISKGRKDVNWVGKRSSKEDASNPFAVYLSEHEIISRLHLGVLFVDLRIRIIAVIN
jgi:hypothetical protein